MRPFLARRFRLARPMWTLLPTAALLAAVITAQPAQAIAPFFSNAQFVPIETNGWGDAVLADLNGDGRLDVVQANTNADRIGVRLGLGGGKFGPLADFPCGDFPFKIAAGDVDGDAIPDIVADNLFAETVSVLHGNGDGSFAAPAPLPTNGRPSNMAIADFDGDGRSDIVTANEPTNSLTLYRAVPGGFAPRIDLPTGPTPEAVVVARLDADAIPDIAVACANAVYLHRGLGGGTFAPPTTLPAEATPFHLAAADLDGDGDADLVAGNLVNCCASMVSIFRGNGDGTFAPRTSHGSGNFSRAVTIADLDGDSAPEILIANGNTNVLSVLQGADGWSYAGQLNFPAGTAPSSVAVADLDGDGNMDAVVGGPRGYAAMLRGADSGLFEPVSPVSMPFGPASVAIGDLNGDGAMDLVIGGSASQTGVRLGQGDGTFAPASEFAEGLVVPLLADLDGDEKLDIVGLGANGLASLLGHGDGTFGARTSFPVSLSPSGIALGDVNGDAKLDVVLTSYGSITFPPGAVWLQLGNGDGSFGPAIGIVGGNIGYTSPALADLDLDGDLDLMILGGGNAISMFRGNGDGTFAPPVTMGPTLPPLPTTLAVARFDGNATPDLILGIQNGVIQIHPGIGDGTFAAPASFSTLGENTNILVGDLDGDGHADLVTVSTGSHIITVARGDGAGGLIEQHNFGTPPYPGGALAIGDLNGDTRPDLALACSNFILPLFNVYPDYPTPTRISFADLEASADRVSLTWFGGGELSFHATVERRGETEAWQALGEVSLDGTGMLRFEDRTVQPGGRYAYRLAWYEGAVVHWTPETWVSVPGAARLALYGARPQPATANLNIAFSLASDDRAALELYDVSGRRLVVREVGMLGAGEHVVDLSSGRDLTSGVYWVRLRQGNASLHARATVLH